MVTELDKLNRAKEYLEALAEGVDPLTGEEMAQDTVLNNVRLSRCFFYVADILRQVIDNGGTVSRPGSQRPFHITPEEISRVAISDNPVPVSIIVKAVNDAVADPGRKKLSVITVTNWLVKQGYLNEQETEPGKHRKALTQKSAMIGMTSEMRKGARGAYEIMLYDSNAQRFLLDNMKNISGE